MRTFLASDVFMHPLCGKGEASEFHFEMGNTDRQTDRPRMRQRKGTRDLGWCSKALATRLWRHLHSEAC